MFFNFMNFVLLFVKMYFLPLKVKYFCKLVHLFSVHYHGIENVGLDALKWVQLPCIDKNLCTVHRLLWTIGSLDQILKINCYFSILNTHYSKLNTHHSILNTQYSILD